MMPPSKRLRTLSSAASCAPSSDVLDQADQGIALDPSELSLAPVVCDGLADCRRGRAKIRRKGKYTFCRLCPWTRQCRDHEQAASFQQRHFATHHPGLTPTGQRPRVLGPLPSLVCDTGKAPAWWRCPLCPQGIDFQTGKAAPPKHVLQAIREHKRACHPRVRWLKWAQLSYKDRAEKATVTRFNAGSAAIISQKACLLGKFEVFRWPRKVGPKSQAISPIAFPVAWVCKTCHATARTAKLAEEHVATNCPNKVCPGLLKVWAHGSLSTLAENRKVLLHGPNSGEAKVRGIALFDQAQPAGHPAICHRRHLGGDRNLVNAPAWVGNVTFDLLAGTNQIRNLHATGPLSIALANDDWTLSFGCDAYTTQQTDDAIAAALTNYFTQAEVTVTVLAALDEAKGSTDTQLTDYSTTAQMNQAIADALNLTKGPSWTDGPTFNLLRGTNVLRNLSVAGALTASSQNLDDTILIGSDSYARSETYTQAETGAAITAAIDALNLSQYRTEAQVLALIAGELVPYWNLIFP